MNKILEKLAGGRFLLTVLCGIVFTVMSISGKLPTDKVMEVILLVIYGYFTRSDRGQNGQPQK